MQKLYRVDVLRWSITSPANPPMQPSARDVQATERSLAQQQTQLATQCARGATAPVPTFLLT